MWGGKIIDSMFRLCQYTGYSSRDIEGMLDSGKSIDDIFIDSSVGSSVFYYPQFNTIESGEFIRRILGRDVRRGILFIFDESHFIGGDKTSEAFLRLYNTYRDGNYFIGSTATSIRGNKLDVTTEYFRGIQPFYYDTNSGMADGLYNPIKCVYCNFNVSSLAVNELNKNSEYAKLSDSTKYKYQKFILNKTREFQG